MASWLERVWWSTPFCGEIGGRGRHTLLCPSGARTEPDASFAGERPGQLLAVSDVSVVCVMGGCARLNVSVSLPVGGVRVLTTETWLNQISDCAQQRTSVERAIRRLALCRCLPVSLGSVHVAMPLVIKRHDFLLVVRLCRLAIPTRVSGSAFMGQSWC